MIRTWLTRSKERTCNPAGRPSRDEKDTDLKNSRDDWEWYFYLVLYCITGHKLILHQKSARAKVSGKGAWGDPLPWPQRAYVCFGGTRNGRSSRAQKEEASTKPRLMPNCKSCG